MNDHRYQRDTVANTLRRIVLGEVFLNSEDRIAKSAEEIVAFFAKEAHASDLALAKARAYDIYCEMCELERRAHNSKVTAEGDQRAFEHAESEFEARCAAVKAMQNGE